MLTDVKAPIGIVTPMKQSGLSVLPASPDDAEAWVAIHLASWREAYSGLVEESVFVEREASREARIADTRRFFERLADGGVGHATLSRPGQSSASGAGDANRGRENPRRAGIAEATGTKDVANATDLSWTRARIAYDGQTPVGIALAHGNCLWAELDLIYVLACAHGSGAADMLVDAALGNGPASLWTARDNERAVAFYRKKGFVPTGEIGETASMPTIRMERRGASEAIECPRASKGEIQTIGPTIH